MIKFDEIEQDYFSGVNEVNISFEIKNEILDSLSFKMETIAKGLKFYYETILENFEGDYLIINYYVSAPNLRGYRKKLFSIEIKNLTDYPVKIEFDIIDIKKEVLDKDALVKEITKYLVHSKVKETLMSLMKENM